MNLKVESNTSVPTEVRVWIIRRMGKRLLRIVAREDESGALWRSMKVILSASLALATTVS